MRTFLLIAGLALVGCTPASSVSTVPGATQACAVLDSSKLDLALKAYDAALDAINLLIDSKVLVPGSPRARAVANGNDKVLAAFKTAESARSACNATSYKAALDAAQAAIAEVRGALHGGS